MLGKVEAVQDLQILEIAKLYNFPDSVHSKQDDKGAIKSASQIPVSRAARELIV